MGLVRKILDENSITLRALALLKYCGEFHQYYSLLKKSQYWSEEQLQTYQNEQLHKLIKHAYLHVPYYHTLFETHHLKPEDIKSLDDIEKIPFLTRDIIRENIDKLKADNYPDDAFEYVTTGGSTGIPLGFYYHSGVSRAREWAFMKTQWDRVGYRFYDKCVILRGNRSDTKQDDVLWSKTLFGRWLILSPYQLKEENLGEYIDQMRRFKPRYIQAYPSLITILAKYMVEHDIASIPSIKCVLCGSEGLLPWQRSLIESAFKCSVYSWYGHSEMAVLAGECERNTEYHIFPEYGYVELIDTQGDVISQPDVCGEITATSFTNYVFPLIRYRTSDLGTYAKGPCSCGRNYKRFKHVDGRIQDLIITSDNRKITLTSLIFAQHFTAFAHISGMQVVQNEAGKITIRIIKGQQYSPTDEEEIRGKIQDAAGSGLDVSFDYVAEISRRCNGKVQFLIQEIPAGEVC